MITKLTFDLHGDNKLHILNVNYYKPIIQNFLKIYFQTKILILICAIFFHNT